MMVPPSFCHHLRTWAEGDFRLDVFDNHRTDSWGKSILGYALYHRGDLIFEGNDFHASPLHTLDGDEVVGSILTFLSLRPGDTDHEYFDSYSDEQLRFAQTYGEELSLYAYELENPDA